MSPLLYAYNESVRQNTQVDLIYLFETSEGHKYKPQDPETLTERIKFVDAHTFKGDISKRVNVEFEYGVAMPQEFNHTNYHDTNTGLHNLRFSDTYRWSKGEGSHVAVISTVKNKEPFPEYKAWKDPLQGRWKERLPMISNSMLIDYETPIETACQLLSTAKYAITYHGSAAWLCKWIGVPMIVVTGNPDWSKTVFPWCVTTNDVTYDMSSLAKQSLDMLSNAENALMDYLKCL